MKQCPKCAKTYDNSWNVCLDDGSALVESKSAQSNTAQIKCADKRMKSEERHIYRPKGVIVLSVLIMIGSLFGFLGNIVFYASGPSMPVYFYLIICPLSFIVCFFLLSMRNFARIAIMVISLLVAAETIYSMGNNARKMDKVYTEQVEASVKKAIYDKARDQKIPENMVTPKMIAQANDMTKGMMKNTMTFFFILSVIFNFAAIYYLSIPAVRRSFK